MKLIGLIAGLALAGVASTASAEVVSTSATGFQLRSSAVLQTTTQAEAWAALGRWGDWWSPSHTYSGSSSNLSLAVEAGGCLCEIWDGGQVEHARVLLAWPDQGLLRMNAPFGPLQAQPVTAILTYTIRPRDTGGVEVIQTFVVGGGDEATAALAPLVDGVMSGGFERLVRFAETGSAD
jgi:hypothetical protein